jgi:hypothetical protein
MKKNLFILILSILVFSLFQINCEKKTIQSRETDWDAVKAIISEYPDVFRLGFYNTVSDTLFYREITQSNADIEEGRRFDADSTHFFEYITLTWGDSLKGTFHYRFDGQAYEKPISSIALTYAYFEKWGYDSDPHRGWLLKQFSGTVINSKGTSRGLDELHIVSEGVDVYLYNTTLMNLVYKDSTLAFGKGKQVTFTVDADDTTDLLSLFVKEEGVYQKIPFTSNGDGTFSAGWTTLSNPDPAIKYYHAIVDVVSRESVTDTTSAYDSKAWGIIYRIK